jgi:hypothetical protein
MASGTPGTISNLIPAWAHAAASAAARPYSAQSAGGGRGRYAQAAHTAKIRVEESIEDIRSDITRIEKEIGLEIKEIQSLKLAL